MKTSILIFISTFSISTFAKLGVPSSVYLDADLIDTKIPNAISMVEQTSEKCEQRDGQNSDCESLKIMTKKEIQSLHINNCNQNAQGSSSASNDCIGYINNRLIDGDGNSNNRYRNIIKVVVPEQQVIAKLLNIPFFKIRQNDKRVSVRSPIQTNPNESHKLEKKVKRRDYVRGSFSLAKKYVSPTTVQGHGFLRNIWSTKFDTDKYNKQDNSFIRLMREHVKKQNQAYLDWCMKRADNVGLQANYSLEGMANIVDSCNNSIEKDVAICGRYTGERVMPGCENYIELNENGRNIANIQKLLNEKKIIGEIP